MPYRMKQRIFIDTSEFESANFQFRGDRLRTVVARVAAGQLEVGMPAVTEMEIRTRLKRVAAEAERALHRARNEARVLRNLDDELSRLLFDDGGACERETRLLALFDSFLMDIQVVRLGYEDANPAKVFELYADGKAPFGSGKKKSEFPDAFALSILEAWGQEEKPSVLIASSDSDLHDGVEHFENLKFVGPLQAVLDLLAKHLDALAPAAEAALESLRDKINASIEERFQNYGFLLEDRDGVVTDIHVSEVHFVANLLHVEEIEELRVEATFDLVVSVNFMAAVSYDDLESGYYDHEDQRFHCFNTIDDTVEGNEIIQATLVVKFYMNSLAPPDFDLDLRLVGDVHINIYQHERPYRRA